jgi:hypothetical protein
MKFQQEPESASRSTQRPTFGKRLPIAAAALFSTLLVVVSAIPAAAAGISEGGGYTYCGAAQGQIVMGVENAWVRLDTGSVGGMNQNVSHRVHFYEWTGSRWTYKGVSPWQLGVTAYLSRNIFGGSNTTMFVMSDGVRGSTWYYAEHELYWHSTYYDPARTQRFSARNMSFC